MELKKKLVPEVAAIHDLSGYGRSALTVCIPVLSAMGVQVCPLPTAVLSSQTDGFDHYAMLDLGDFMPRIAKHWEQLEISFDAIYSGFLGSSGQITFVDEFIHRFKRPGQIVLVDPVLGDGGIPYGPINGNHIKGMKHLIKHADIITPNVTEASMLLRRDIKTAFSVSEIKDWLYTLAAAGPRYVMITSVPIEHEGSYAVCVYDKSEDIYMKFPFTLIPGTYPGTGDTFASIVLGGILKGHSIPDSVNKALKFLSATIELTNKTGTPYRNGLALEAMLPELWKESCDEAYEKL